MIIYLKRIFLTFALFATACATLPDTQFYTSKYRNQSAQFENARGALSAKRSAAIIAELKRKAGDLDILDKQIALEQEVVGNPLVIGNKITLLQDGPATYAEMFAAIKSAKDHINMESFIIEEDEIGRQFADLLIERQQSGVQVHIIYDSIGTINTSTVFFEQMKSAGVQVLEFNPLNPLNAKKSWSPNHRDHRKLLIIDGKTAFLGGINISSVYASGSSSGNSFSRSSRVNPNDDTTQKKSASKKVSGEKSKAESGWRDTDVKLEGPIVAQFQQLFIDTWTKQQGQNMPAKDYFPSLLAQGKDIARAIGSTPDDPFSLMYLTLISAITNAEKQVYITNAYFVPDPQLLKALIEAARRGVDVRLLLPSHTDSSAAFYAGRSYFTELLEGGVKIYERRGALLHAKTAMIDGVWATVGSSNLDWRSALDNDEVNAVIIGREFSQQMQTAYLKDLTESDEINLATWQNRSLILKLKEAGARLFGRLL